MFMPLFYHQMEIDKILAEDPTVCEYDSIYDDMQQNKQQKESKMANKTDKKVLHC